MIARTPLLTSIRGKLLLAFSLLVTSIAAQQFGALVGAVIALVGFLMVYAISTLITRPLTALSQTAGRIAGGEMNVRAVGTSDVEVVELVRAFNHMVDSVATAQRDLSTANDQLEARVALRTVELTEAIAEQRRVQDALANSEVEARLNAQMLQSLIDVAPQAIIAVDLNGRVTRWNKGAETLFGWTSDEILGQVLEYIPTGLHQESEALKMLATGQGTDIGVTETVRLRKDGRPVSVLRGISILRDADGRPLNYVAVLTDLTERKLLEEQLRQSQKMEAVGCLAGGVAHDFNNMLTVIISCAAMMLERSPSPDDAEDLEAIATSAARAAALTRQLLLFSRKQVTTLYDLDVNLVVEDMEPMLRRLLRENIALNTVLTPGIAEVTADPSQLEQVILNLVVNASDAMPDGGQLTIETRVVVLDEDYAFGHPSVTPGPYLMLAVSDTGVGMDAATIERIFEPFFTTKELGTGLGLATTYAVVQQRGGHIRVYSEPGNGSAFKVFLPCAGAASVRHRRTPASSAIIASSIQHATVLLVEDELSVKIAIRRTLDRIGIRVVEASDGENALAVAANFEGSIDVLVTDLMMPGMNGRTLSERLVAERPELRVVFISGYTDETVNRRGLVDSTRVFLQKPFSGEQLSRAINEVLCADAQQLHTSALLPELCAT